MSKRKRVSQYGEDSCQQLKIHVGPKEISCNSPLHMCAVYGMVHGYNFLLLLLLLCYAAGPRLV